MKLSEVPVNCCQPILGRHTRLRPPSSVLHSPVSRFPSPVSFFGSSRPDVSGSITRPTLSLRVRHPADEAISNDFKGELRFNVTDCFARPDQSGLARNDR